MLWSSTLESVTADQCLCFKTVVLTFLALSKQGTGDSLKTMTNQDYHTVEKLLSSGKPYNYILI